MLKREFELMFYLIGIIYGLFYKVMECLIQVTTGLLFIDKLKHNFKVVLKLNIPRLLWILGVIIINEAVYFYCPIVVLFVDFCGNPAALYIYNYYCINSSSSLHKIIHRNKSFLYYDIISKKSGIVALEALTTKPKLTQKKIIFCLKNNWRGKTSS